MEFDERSLGNYTVLRRKGSTTGDGNRPGDAYLRSGQNFANGPGFAPMRVT